MSNQITFEVMEPQPPAGCLAMAVLPEMYPVQPGDTRDGMTCVKVEAIQMKDAPDGEIVRTAGNPLNVSNDTWLWRIEWKKTGKDEGYEQSQH